MPIPSCACPSRAPPPENAIALHPFPMANAPVSLFDPALFERVRKPLLEAEGLPPACYTDADFFRAEIAGVFSTGWLLAGRADRVAEAGDYFTLESAAGNLIVLRDGTGRVRVYANACRHRGVPLARGEGRTRMFVCPYHAWSYGLDGSLRGCAGMEATAGFERADYGLLEIRSESWAGFVFYNLDGRAPPLAEWLGELPERLAMYRLDEMVATRVVTHDVACNWKTWVENYMEGYHIPTVHRSTISNKKAVNTPEDPGGAGQYRAIFERHEGTLALIDGDAGFPPIESLEGDSVRGSRFMLVYPATMLALCIDAMWVFHVLPLAPELTRVVHISMFPKSRLTRADFAGLAANYYKRQDRVVAEDNGIAALQQQGLRSPLTRPGRFAAKEKIVHALDNWVLDRVLAAGGTARA